MVNNVDPEKLEVINQLIIDELYKTSKDPKRGKFNSTHEGLGVILEEFEEFKDAVKLNNSYSACQEAIQLAAMAIRYNLDFNFSDYASADLTGG